MTIDSLTQAHRQLRILVIGKSMAPDCMESHVVHALKVMGHETMCLTAAGRVPAQSTLLQRIEHRIQATLFREPERIGEPRLLRRVADFAPDLVLVIQGNQLSPKSVAAIRKVTRSPVACWCQDAISSYGRQFVLGAGYDAVFVKDRYLSELFAGHISSSRFFYLPEACNADVHRPVPLTESIRRQYGCEVLMLGSLYYYRQELLHQLTEFDLRIYGHRPQWLSSRLDEFHRGSDLVLEQKAQAIAAASISLNPLHCAEINGLNCRAFELAGCGGFQIMSDKPVLAEHFVPGVEMETFSSVSELKEKLHHYLKHPEQAAQIAQRGCERAHRHHTYVNRLSELLRIMRLAS